MSERRLYDLDQIKNAMGSRIDDLVMQLFPEAKREASCYKIGDIYGKKGGSLMISTRPQNAGYFQDFADPDMRGRPWKLVALNKGLSIAQGIEWLANFLNIQPIQSFGAQARAKNPSKLSSEIRPLTKDSIAYAEERKISVETLKLYGVGSDAQGKIVFPVYDEFGQLGMLKHWGLTPKPDGSRDTWISPDAIQCLFGKDTCPPETVNQLVITEGEWDAMACREMGIPAVSVPMGAGNLNWITLDYQYLSLFDDIVILFDNDDVGQQAAKQVLARLGQERAIIVKLPLKDANDMLKAGRGSEIRKIIDTTVREPIAEIVDNATLKENTRAFMKGDFVTTGDAFFMPGFDLTFRPHEVTLWFGYSGHGKSSAVEDQIAFLAGMGKPVLVASFEQLPEMTLGKVLKKYSARPNLPYEEEFDAAFDHLGGLVFLYKSLKRADPVHLIQTFTHAHKRYGIDTFVIDNVMTMDVDRDDNKKQAEAADAIRVFASAYPVHIHVVAHPRKPKEDTKVPPNMAEIRGASEWGDMPQNIIVVWRDVAKGEQLEEMIANDFDPEEIRKFYESTPCGKIICRKQRATGRWPMTKFWFHEFTGRFMPKPGSDPLPFYPDGKPWVKDDETT